MPFNPPTPLEKILLPVHHVKWRLYTHPMTMCSATLFVFTTTKMSYELSAFILLYKLKQKTERPVFRTRPPPRWTFLYQEHFWEHCKLKLLYLFLISMCVCYTINELCVVSGHDTFCRKDVALKERHLTITRGGRALSSEGWLMSL